MIKINKWRSRPIRYAGASRVGRIPLHLEGRYRVLRQLMKFLNEQYGATSMICSQFNIGKFLICTRCYDEYKMDQLKSTRNFPINLELVNNENESAEDTQLRLSVDSTYARRFQNYYSARKCRRWKV